MGASGTASEVRCIFWSFVFVGTCVLSPFPALRRATLGRHVRKYHFVDALNSFDLPLAKIRSDVGKTGRSPASEAVGRACHGRWLDVVGGRPCTSRSSAVFFSWQNACFALFSLCDTPTNLVCLAW